MYKNNKVINNIGLLMIIIVYNILNFVLIINNIKLYTNIFNPLLWIMIILYFIWYVKKYYIRFCENKKYYIYLFIIIFFQIIFYFCFGLMFGFSKGTLDYSIIGILKNFLIQIVPIIGIELLRILLIVRNKDNKSIIILITVMLILAEINYGTIIDIYKEKEVFFKYICSTIFPLIANSVLCTYLAKCKLYLFSLLYRVSTKLLLIILPILPNISWFITGSTNIILSVIIYLFFKYKNVNNKYKKKI